MSALTQVARSRLKIDKNKLIIRSWSPIGPAHHASNRYQ